MIEKLSLSPDFAKWSWEQSNGNASDEQTQKSYEVVTDKGKCAGFSYLVWNDIVDTLANALDGIGIEWDDKYCSAEESKIQESLGILMAYAWNSVAWNIKRFGFVLWKWARTTDTPGCLGRDVVYGFSQVGEDADYLYAWYILEIIKKLNRLIEVFQDAADFSEFNHMLKSSSIMDVTLATPKIEAVKSSAMSESKEWTTLVELRPQAQTTMSIARSQPYVLLTPDSVAAMSYCKQKIETYSNSFLLPAGAAAMSFFEQKIETHSNSHLFLAGAAAMSFFEQKIETHSNSFLFSAGAAAMPFLQNVASEIIAHAASGHSAAASSILKSEAMLLPSAFFASGHSAAMFARIISSAPYISNGNSIRVKAMYAYDKSESKSESEVISSRAKFAEATQSLSESAGAGILLPKDRILMNSAEESKSAQNSILEIRRNINFDSVNISKSTTVASLSSFRNERWYDPRQNGTDLYIRNVYMQHDETPNVHIGHKFYEAEQNGNDLHIKSVYVQKQHDGDLNFGVVYYKPEQTGTDIYIRSAESLKGV